MYLLMGQSDPQDILVQLKLIFFFVHFAYAFLIAESISLIISSTSSNPTESLTIFSLIPNSFFSFFESL